MHTGLLVRSMFPTVFLSLAIWQSEQHYLAAEDTTEFLNFNVRFAFLQPAIRA